MRDQKLAVIIALGASPLVACAGLTSAGLPSERSIARLESQLSMPSGAAPLDAYARYYAFTVPAHPEDAPFTTWTDGAVLPVGRQIVIGVFLKPEAWGNQPLGVHAVTLSEIPYAVHGGCWAVNVAYDPEADRVLAVWCNVDENAAPPPPEGDF